MTKEKLSVHSVWTVDHRKKAIQFKFRKDIKMYFINFSNHPGIGWTEKQKDAAKVYGEFLDFPFPNINPNDTEEDLDTLVEKYYLEIIKYEEPTVMMQGEFTFTYRMICRLKQAGIKVIAACTERCTKEVVNEDGKIEKRSVFEFVKFREY